MLVLSRKVGEKIVINENITVVVNRVVGNRVSLGIEAPRDVDIVRGELKEVRETFSQEAAAPDVHSQLNIFGEHQTSTDSLQRLAR